MPSGSFKFIHCADLHLGSAFAGLSRKIPELAEILVDSPFRVWHKVVAFACAEKADFLLLSGDVFDRSAPSLRGRLEFVKGLEELERAGIFVFLTSGNHDPFPSAWSEAVKLPSNVHFFPVGEAQVIPFEKDGEIVASIGGISYGNLEQLENFCVMTGKALTGAPGVHIAVVHANLAGDKHAAPATEAELAALPVDYWALGHIHKPMVLRTKPYVVYSGTPQGRAIKDEGPRGIRLVECDLSGVVRCDFVPVSLLDFHPLEVNLSNCGSFSEAAELFAGAVKAIPRKNFLLIRLLLTGRSSLDAELRRSAPEDLREMFTAAAKKAYPDCALESVRILTHPPVTEEQKFFEEEIERSRKEMEESGELEKMFVDMQSSRRELSNLRTKEFENIRQEAAALAAELLSGAVELKS